MLRQPAQGMRSPSALGLGRCPRQAQSLAGPARLVQAPLPRLTRRDCRSGVARTTQAVAAPPQQQQQQQQTSGNGVVTAERHEASDLEVDSVLAKELGENGALSLEDGCSSQHWTAAKCALRN